MNEVSEKTLKYRRRWFIFWVLAAQYLLSYFHRIAPAVVAPELVKTFNISGASLGLLASAYLYSYTIMQIPVGIFSDSLGPRKTITIFSLIAAAGSVLFGLSPDYIAAVASRVLIGLGVSAVFVATMKVFSEWFTGEEHARVSGMLMSVGGIGWLSATTPLAFLMLMLGWRESFVLVGLFALALTIVTWFVVSDSPGREGLLRTGEEITSRKKNNGAIDNIKIVFKEKHFWAIAIWFFFRGGALLGFFGLWAGPYIIDVYKLSKQTTGNILAMIAFAMIFLSPVLGHLSDKTLMSRKKVLVGASLLNSLCWLVMLVFYDSMSIPALYAVFFIMGVTISSVGILAIVTTKEFFPPEIAGTAMGSINVFPFIGGIVFQPLIGWILDKSGKFQGTYEPSAYLSIIWLLFVTSIVALISIMFSEETFNRNY